MTSSGDIMSQVRGMQYEDDLKKPGDLTSWLRRWDRGDDEARQRVFDLVYAELKRSAVGQFRAERWWRVSGTLKSAIIRCSRQRWCTRFAYVSWRESPWDGKAVAISLAWPPESCDRFWSIMVESGGR